MRASKRSYTVALMLVCGGEPSMHSTMPLPTGLYVQVERPHCNVWKVDARLVTPTINVTAPCVTNHDPVSLEVDSDEDPRDRTFISIDPARRAACSSRLTLLTRPPAAASSSAVLPWELQMNAEQPY